jgi:uncharacterized HAD superfamily protein
MFERKRKIGIDVDGVLANFNDDYGRILVETSGRNLIPANFTIDDIDTWHWEKKLGYTAKEVDAVWRVIDTHPFFWSALRALPGARHLTALNAHDVYFITSRPGVTAKQQTENWLVAHGIFRPTVLISSKKGPVVAGLDLDFFVDDKLENCVEVEAAAPNTRVYLLDYKYNRDMAFNRRVQTLTQALVSEQVIGG